MVEILNSANFFERGGGMAAGAIFSEFAAVNVLVAGRTILEFQACKPLGFNSISPGFGMTFLAIRFNMRAG